VLDYQQPQDDFDRCRRPACLDRVWPTSTQIGFDLQENLVVFEQSIQFSQLGLKTQLKRGYHREQVDRRGSIS
jgi:hypothetical protein